MAKSRNPIRFVQETILVILLILIGWEWLKTVPVTTDTDQSFLWVFMVPFASILAIYLLIPWKWVRPLPVIVFLTYWYAYTQMEASFFSIDWVKRTKDLLSLHAEHLYQFQWHLLDGALRTALFLIGIWFVVHVVFEHSIRGKKALGLMFISVVYFSILDTFYIFDGKYPVMKTIIYGLLMQAMISFSRMEQITRKKISNVRLIPWIGVSLVIILIFSSIGFIAPKAEPSWPDPVTFMNSYKTGGLGVGDNGSGGKSGYGDNDRTLGGPFIQTEDLVLIGQVTGDGYPAHYWRGESKDIYTGKGWETSPGVDELSYFPLNQKIPYRLIGLTGGQEIVEDVWVLKQRPILFTAGQPLQFIPSSEAGFNSQGQDTLLVNKETFRFQSNNFTFEKYSANSIIPNIPRDTLTDISERLGNSKDAYPAEITERYLQLPDNLPSRVKELTDRIVGTETNTYTKIKSIERYLRIGPYQYETTDVPVPEEDQDYVDQFLFETQRGYCDNFSTAMVVMLRTQGIPARWVKGYTFGELKRVDQPGDQPDLYATTVREKNAHSWVEAYFPGVGWVPFEPTPAFSYPYEIVSSESMEATNTETEEVVDEEKINELLEEVKEDTKESMETMAPTEENPLTFANGRIIAVIFGLLLLLAGVFIFIRRETIRMNFLSSKFIKENEKEMIIKAYAIVHRLLEKTFFPRPEDQTAREYTDALRLHENRKSMIHLTRLFEESRYGERQPTIRKETFISLWKDLFKRLRP